jgi:peroxiredoxin
MKTIKFFLALISFAASGSQYATAQTKPDFIINGTLKEMSNTPALLYLKVKNIPIDTAIVTNGKYQFSGKIEEGDIAQIVGEPTSSDAVTIMDMTTILLDKGTLNISSEGSLKQSSISGSGPIAEATKDYLEANKRVIEMGSKVSDVMKSEEYKTNLALQASVSASFSTLMKLMADDNLAFVRSHPNSFVVPVSMMQAVAYAMMGQAEKNALTPDDIESLIKTFPEATQLVVRNKLGKAYEDWKVQSAVTSLGVKAVDFTQNDVNGKPVSLSSFKGKYVLIDFWASWCKPCRAENPSVVKAYQAYKDKGFTVLGISLDTDSQKADWLEAIQKDGLTWTQLSDLKSPNAVAELYGVQSIPKNFLVDPNGVIVAKNLRGEELIKKLAELIR